MRPLVPALTLAAIVVVLASGCGGKKSGGGSATTVSGTTITLVEKNFSLTPSAITITITKPGTYTINAENHGGTSHGIAIDGQGVQQTGATVDPGGTSTITVTLTKPGDYAVFCPVGNHRSLGMEAALKLTGAGSAGPASTKKDTSGGYG